MVIASHEIHFARDVADRIAFIDGGMIGEQGPPARILADPASPRPKLFLRRHQGDYLAA
jgi:polar amino acid transport system ATP-binding protein